MNDATRTCDVFISHSANDAKLAVEIADACRANGLAAIAYAELSLRADAGDILWEALAESKALLVILSRVGPTPSMAIELGAARAWNKPIFGIVTDPAFVQLPPALSGIELFTSGRIEDVIRAIKVGGQELSENDRTVLVKLYTKLGVSVDQLALEPRQLEELVKRFASRAAKAVPGERLLSELLRMRKQGKLPRSRPMRRSKLRKGPA
jgi:hypothetical protein